MVQIIGRSRMVISHIYGLVEFRNRKESFLLGQDNRERKRRILTLKREGDKTTPQEIVSFV